MALIQRHIKRMLAFSTISHVGIMLIGLALLDNQGLAGMLSYLIGHGLVKGSLFAIAGILMATCGGIDEIGLRGLGRAIWPAGIVMAIGGLLLAGAPVGLMDQGIGQIDATAPGWAVAAIIVGAACTGGAVLRVTGRVFLGLGVMAGEEARAPTEKEQEKADRPLWLMLTPAAILLGISLPAALFSAPIAAHAAAQVIGSPAAASAPLRWVPWLSLFLAVAIAALDLFRGRVAHAATNLTRPISVLLQNLHSGIVGDYVAWMAVGLALFALALW
jgi:multicomponent Na+:H+ antiporter subunit D